MSPTGDAHLGDGHRGLDDLVEERLLADRVVPLFGRLDDAAVTGAAARLWSLDALGEAPVRLMLSLQGGSVEASLALLDVLDVIGVEVHATCLGMLSGPPLAVLAGAQRREAAPSSRFLLRDEPVELSGSYRQLEQAARLHAERRLQLLSRLAAATGGRHSPGD